MANRRLKLVESRAGKGSRQALPPPPQQPPARTALTAVEPPSEEYLAEPVPLANYDRAIRAAVARASRGIAWPSLVSAWADWYWHLAAAPSKQMELASKAREVKGTTRTAAQTVCSVFSSWQLRPLNGRAITGPGRKHGGLRGNTPLRLLRLSATDSGVLVE